MWRAKKKRKHRSVVSPCGARSWAQLRDHGLRDNTASLRVLRLSAPSDQMAQTKKRILSERRSFCWEVAASDRWSRRSSVAHAASKSTFAATSGGRRRHIRYPLHTAYIWRRRVRHGLDEVRHAEKAEDGAHAAIEVSGGKQVHLAGARRPRGAFFYLAPRRR